MQEIIETARDLAHPRSRGEHLRHGEAGVLDSGSSPLTRGALLGHHVCQSTGGLIPAHAGSTKSWGEK